MSNKTIRYISYLVKGGLLILPIMALLVSTTMFFPFITMKNFFFRIGVEVLLLLWVFLMVFDKKYRPRLSPVLLSLASVLFFLTLGTIFAESPYRAFWSNYERMEGLVSHLHLFSYFLILTSVFQKKKDWKLLFGLMLGVSAIATIHGFMQLAGKVSIHQSGDRLDASFGNSGYYAIFMIFSIFLTSLFIFWTRKMWARILLGVFAVLQGVMVFCTATRGAILGLIGGLCLFGLMLAVFSKNKKVRYSFIGALAVLLVLVGLFIVFKDSSFIRNNYVFSRLASIDIKETTVSSRFMIWNMSWHGFQEHPVLGWGIENYNVVFNKYYDPGMWGQEPWFDRSHNIVFDWLTSSGLPGLASYLALFASGLYLVYRGRKRKEFSLLEASAIVSVFAAYFFHNIFVFDNITSYYMFFTILGYLHFSDLRHKPKKEEKRNKKKEEEIGMLGYVGITFTFCLVVFSLYYINAKPMMASKGLLKALYLAQQNQPVDNVLAAYDEVFRYNTFGNMEAREQLSGYANTLAVNTAVAAQERNKAVAKGIEEMEIQVANYPKDARQWVMLGSLYTRAMMVDEALEAMDKALELSPKKQHFLFAKADIYLATGQGEEAVKLLKEAYGLDEDYKGAAVNLVKVAILYAPDYAKELLDELAGKFGEDIRLNKEFINSYVKVGDYEKTRDIWLKVVEGEPNNPQYRVSLAATYTELGDKQKAREQLEKVIEIDERFREQAEQLMVQFNLK